MSELFASSVGAIAPPIADGRCDELAWAQSGEVLIDRDVRLRAMADRHFLYLCVDFGAPSLGSTDLLLAGKQFKSGMHVSAKLGEFSWHDDSRVTYSWIASGWVASTSAFDRFVESGDGLMPRFGSVRQREFQISRTLFNGERTLALRMEVQGVGADDFRRITYPAGSERLNTQTWTILNLSDG